MLKEQTAEGVWKGMEDWVTENSTAKGNGGISALMLSLGKALISMEWRKSTKGEMRLLHLTVENETKLVLLLLYEREHTVKQPEE